MMMLMIIIIIIIIIIYLIANGLSPGGSGRVIQCLKFCKKRTM